MALNNKVIVILGNTRFDSAISATSLFVARNLAIDNKVFFVDYPFTFKDYITYTNSPELTIRKSKFSLLSDGIIDTDMPNLKIIIAPPVVPINFLPEGMVFRMALKINEALVAKRITKALKVYGITDFIFINSFNFHFPHIAKSIKPRLSIYQCVDPLIVPYDRKHGIVSENMLIKESDLVICTSKALYDEKKTQNKNTYFVPNAADTAHCGQALNPELPIYSKIVNLPKPIIGYLGSIERRLDYDLLLAVTKANPDKTFVFAGPVWHEYVPKALAKMINVHIIGPVPYPEIPQLVKGFDVAIIPFKKDEVSATIFPLKLFEYLSAGKPVVVSDFNPDLKDYTADVVCYASNATEFTQAINDALADNNEEILQKRLAVARLNTWEKRTEDISKIISEHLH